MTLIEAVLFISVALGLIVGGIVVFQQATISGRTAQQVRVLASLFAETRSLFARQDVSGINQALAIDAALIASGSVPPDIVGSPMGSGGTRLRTQWDTALGLWFQPSGADDLLVVVQLDRIPVAACARLAVTDASGAGPFTNGIWLAVMSNDEDSGSDVSDVPPIAPSDAAAMCTAADTDGDGRVLLAVGALAYR